MLSHRSNSDPTGTSSTTTTTLTSSTPYKLPPLSSLLSSSTPSKNEDINTTRPNSPSTTDPMSRSLTPSSSPNSSPTMNHSLSLGNITANTTHHNNHITTPSNNQIKLPPIDHLTSSPDMAKRSNSTGSIPYHHHHHHHHNTTPFHHAAPVLTTNKSLPPIPSHISQAGYPASIVPPSLGVFTKASPVNTNNVSHTEPLSNNNQQPMSFNQQNVSPTAEGIKTQSKKQQQQQHAETSNSKKFAFISHSQATFLNHEPDIDNLRLARRKRRRTTPVELNVLQTEFEKGHTPNKQRRLEIAQLVDMSEKSIQIWFQNKRQNLRKNNTMVSSEVILDIPKRKDLDQQYNTTVDDSTNGNNSFDDTTNLSIQDQENESESDINTTVNSISSSPSNINQLRQNQNQNQILTSSPSAYKQLPPITTPNTSIASSSTKPYQLNLPPQGSFMPVQTPHRPTANNSLTQMTPVKQTGPMMGMGMTFKFRTNPSTTKSKPSMTSHDSLTSSTPKRKGRSVLSDLTNEMNKSSSKSNNNARNKSSSGMTVFDSSSSLSEKKSSSKIEVFRDSNNDKENMDPKNKDIEVVNNLLSLRSGTPVPSSKTSSSAGLR